MGTSITDQTRKLLWARSGDRCARDKVRLSVEGAHPDPDCVLGEECHIIARSEQGPRGDASLGDHERNTYDNLILLCPNCHTLVDSQPHRYDAGRLREMKTEHELWVQSVLGAALAKDPDLDSVLAYYQAMDRYALRLAMHREERSSFIKAIQDMRAAITTGIVMTSEGVVVARVKGKALLQRQETRVALNRFTDMLLRVEEKWRAASESGILIECGNGRISDDEVFLTQLDDLRNQAIMAANEVFHFYRLEPLPMIRKPVVRGLGHTTVGLSQTYLLNHAYEDTPAPPARSASKEVRVPNGSFPGERFLDELKRSILKAAEDGK